MRFFTIKKTQKLPSNARPAVCGDLLLNTTTTATTTPTSSVKICGCDLAATITWCSITVSNWCACVQNGDGGALQNAQKKNITHTKRLSYPCICRLRYTTILLLRLFATPPLCLCGICAQTVKKGAATACRVPATQLHHRRTERHQLPGLPQVLPQRRGPHGTHEGHAQGPQRLRRSQ